MSFNSRLKATKIIVQRKAFYRQKIPGSSCAMKETVDIDMLVTSTNGDRKKLDKLDKLNKLDILAKIYHPEPPEAAYY